MLRLSMAANILLALALGAAAYLFIFRGSVAPASDGRTAVIVQPGEKDLILGEMRKFLEAVRNIAQASAAGDMEKVVTAAHAVGGQVAEAVPPALMGKLPIAFKTLGHATHGAFDDLAEAARKAGTRESAMAALGDLLENCTSCHAEYRLEAHAGK